MEYLVSCGLKCSDISHDWRRWRGLIQPHEGWPYHGSVMEHLDPPYFVLADAQYYVTLHADIMDNTDDPSLRCKPMRRLCCLTTRPTLLRLSWPIPSANRRKLQSLLVNRTTQLLNMALIYIRLYPVLFPLHRVQRFQPQTFRKKTFPPSARFPVLVPVHYFCPWVPQYIWRQSSSQN